jgi:exosortase
MAATHEDGRSSPGSPGSQERQGTTLAGLLTDALNDPSRRVTVLGGLACLALFAMLFRDSLWHFYYSWTTDDNYSHGFLVPLLSLYFAHQVAQRGPVPVRAGGLLGGSLLGTAVLVRLLTIPLPIPFLGDLALLAGLAGVFALLLGTDALKRYWFVFFFLVFMVPLPIALYSRIASPLQLLASQAASMVMNVTGLPVLCEGNRMTLPGGVQMFVAEACSGMRQMTGFLALTAAVAYLTTRPGWYKAIVVLSALPIALTANVARVVLTGYVMHYVNPEYASGAYHTLEGILLMGFGLLLLNSLCTLLNQVFPDPPNNEPPSDGTPHDPPAASRGLSARPVLSSTGPGSLRWPSSSIAENLVPLTTPKELP